MVVSDKFAPNEMHSIGCSSLLARNNPSLRAVLVESEMVLLGRSSDCIIHMWHDDSSACQSSSTMLWERLKMSVLGFLLVATIGHVSFAQFDITSVWRAFSWNSPAYSMKHRTILDFVKRSADTVGPMSIRIVEFMCKFTRPTQWTLLFAERLRYFDIVTRRCCCMASRAQKNDNACHWVISFTWCF